MVRLLALRALRFSRFLLPSAVPTLFAVIVSLRPSGELLRTRDPRGGDLGKKASSGLKCDDGTRCSLVAEVRLDVVVLLSEAVTLGASKGGITLLHIARLTVLIASSGFGRNAVGLPNNLGAVSADGIYPFVPLVALLFTCLRLLGNRICICYRRWKFVSGTNELIRSNLYCGIYISIYIYPAIRQALSGRLCSFNAAGFMKPQNVTMPTMIHSTFTM